MSEPTDVQTTVLSDEELMTAVKNDGEAAADTLFRRYWRVALGWCGRCCPENAEDIVQKGFIRAWQYRKSYKDRTFRQWFYRIVQHELFASLNERRRSQRVEEAVRQALKVFEPIPSELNTDPELRAINEELCKDLMCSVKSLPDALRRPIELVLEEMSIEEIAKHLGIPEGTVKSRLHRGRVELGKRLAEQDV